MSHSDEITKRADLLVEAWLPWLRLEAMRRAHREIRHTMYEHMHQASPDEPRFFRLAVERSYRHGYHAGFSAAIAALESHSRTEVASHLEILTAWRYRPKHQEAPLIDTETTHA